MNLIDIIIIGIGLAMDAFAVSICKGLSFKKRESKKALVIAGYFALFQMLMPLLGYLMGTGFSSIVEKIDHWIAFILLSIIGGNMIREGISDLRNPSSDNSLDNDDISFKIMLPLAIATSIDALVVGITFAFLKVNLLLSVSMIGIITFIICIIGVWMGRHMGNRLHDKAELFGGIILVIIGTKILLEHTIFS